MTATLEAHMQAIDLAPIAAEVAALVQGVSDSQLADPSPCPEWSVGDLVDHVGGLAPAFVAAAVKRPLAGAGGGQGDGGRLEPGWRERIGRGLDDLAGAWRAEDAWAGETGIGAMVLPADVASQVVLNELVVHGWDLARATGQAYRPDVDAVGAAHRFVTPLAMMDPSASGAFAAPVAVTDGATLLEEVIAHNGRPLIWVPA